MNRSDRADLADRLRRHNPSPGLLDDVAALLDQYAADRVAEALETARANPAVAAGIVKPDVAKPAAKAAPRRAPARGQRRAGTGKAAT